MRKRNKNVSTIELEVDDSVIDEVFEEGVSCTKNVEVGQIVDCLLTMFEHIQETNMVQGFKRALGPGQEHNVDKFLIMLLVSEVATINGNFGGQEEIGEA